MTLGSLSSTTWIPDVVGYLSRPVLIAIVLATTPFTTTVILSVTALTVEICEAPMVKLRVRFSVPHTPLPASTPFRLACKVTTSPAGQYCIGR